MNYQAIGANIKAERKKQHITQEQLAEKAGISTNFLACIEIGIKQGSFETYVRIANALHITLDTLVADILSACRENPLKDELNFYFDNSPTSVQEFIVNIVKVIYNEDFRSSAKGKEKLTEKSGEKSRMKVRTYRN